MKLAIFTRGMSEVEIAALDRLFDKERPPGARGFFRRYAHDNRVIYVKYPDDDMFGDEPPVLSHSDEDYAERTLRFNPETYKRCKPKFQVSVDVSLVPQRLLDRATGYVYGNHHWSAYILFASDLNKTQLEILDKKLPSRHGEKFFSTHPDRAIYLDGIYSDNIHHGLTHYAQQKIRDNPERFQEIVPEFTVKVTATLR